MEILELVGICFTEGFYTHQQYVEVVTSQELHSLIPIMDEPIAKLCNSVLEALNYVKA